MRFCVDDLVDGVVVALADRFSSDGVSAADSRDLPSEQEVAASVATALGEIKAGRAIVVTDDAQRENEGDLIMAAQHASESHLAFFVRYTSGIVTVALSAARAALLRCPPMVPFNEAPLETAFTVSVDGRKGLTTGISAKERAATIRALADPRATAEDFVRPGHVFPLIAKEGGVLERPGHTEAAYDLARLAELEPVGVLAEIVCDDGSVAKGDALDNFVVEHRLKKLSIETLMRWRQIHRRLLKRRTTIFSARVSTDKAFSKTLCDRCQQTRIESLVLSR